MTALVVRGDARALPLPDGSVDLIVTSPPFYALRSYQDGGEHYEGQIGSEATPAEYIDALVDCTREWMRVLKPTGSLFVNLGDKYGRPGGGADVNPRTLPGAGKGTTRRVRTASDGGGRDKCLMLLPERYRIACVDQLGLIARAEIVWSKPNGLPESVTDRVRRSHEQWFHFVIRPHYYSAVDEIREPASDYARPNGNGRAARGGQRPRMMLDACNPLGKLPGSVWSIPSEPLVIPPAVAHARCCGGRDPECQRGVDHYAAFPTEWPRRIITGWSPPGICVECGEGRRPVADKTLMVDHIQARKRGFGEGTGRGALGNHGAGAGKVNGSYSVAITGYACACPEPTAPTRPAVVVDPFGGTGTTALMADVLGRTGISVDRSMDYARLAVWRTTDPGERARAMRVPKPPVPLAGQPVLTGLEMP